MSIKHFVIILAFFAVTISAIGQRTKITAFEREALSEQLQTYLNQSTSDKDKQKANANIATRFNAVYAALSTDRQDQVVSSANVMLNLKMRGLPDMYNYMEAFINMGTASQIGSNFNAWLDAVTFIQSRNKKLKDLNDFVEFTLSFLSERNLGGSRSAKWQAQTSAPYSISLEGSEIVFTFDKPFELYYSSDKDNGTIYGTTGKYFYFDSRWEGNGGRLNWDRTGIAPSECWAVLNKYVAVTKFPKFTADSVMFTNTRYFKTPIMGRVEEALSAKLEPSKYTFPKFRSYQRDFRLKNILPNVDYSGSFMMNGSKFITSDTKNPATLLFYRNGNPFITVRSTKFTITSERVASELAEVCIHIDEDSIFNNGISVRYSTATHQVVMVNDSKRNYYGPYTNTYQNIDMYCEQIVWDEKKDVLEMSMLGASNNQSFSSFESTNYYSERKFREIQGIDEINPVVKVYRYMQGRGMAYEFYIDEFAAAIHMDIIQAKSMIHTLAHSGLVTYNESENRVYVKDKLVDYYRAFSKDAVSDYDALVLESATTGNNASIDLKSNDMRMGGVKRFVLSDSQQVAITPLNGNLTMKKNRDINFSGRIDAGRFIVFVTNATFNYDDFRLDLPQVDSMLFYVTQFNNPQKDHIVYTPLYELEGNIQIDQADNHSGLKRTEDFPVFTSTKESHVYYDRRNILGGTYTRDKFYYTLRPFVIKDMVDFVTDSLRFGGVLTSAGIFPDIDEPLRVQRDYSLGFTTKTPKNGYPCYGGKGKYNNIIDLSYQGLRGAGKLEYLSAQIASKQFFFMPDSSVAVTDTFVVAERNGFPQMNNGKALQRWFPYEDSMRVQKVQGGHHFKMYRGESLLDGNVVLRPSQASAEGTFIINEGSITSQRFTLQTRTMDAVVSHFVLRSDVYNNIAFTADNMRSHVDYDRRRADFVSNVPMGHTDLPLLHYAAYVDKFSWEIDKKQLDLINSQSEATQGMEGLNIRERLAHSEQPGARFVSTNPKCDSLTFHSCKSTYSYNAGQLSCKKVFIIRSADAAIMPSGDSLHVRAGGEIDLLKSSSLLASTSNGYHLIYNADIMLFGAKRYSAKGYIDYVDITKKKQPIFLSEIEPNTAGVSIGEGFISDSSHFTVNSALGFAGNVRMEADKQFFYFDGGIRLLTRCSDESKQALLAYKSYLDPEHIRVEVPKLPTDWHGNRISASLIVDRATNMQPRSAFLTSDRAADNEIMSAFGFLSFDESTMTYTIASEEKLQSPDEVVAPYLSLNNSTCVIKGEGPITFPTKQNMVSVFAYGTAEMSVGRPESLEMSTVFGFKFPMEDKIIEAMTQFITEDLRLAPSTAEDDVLRRAMIHHLGVNDGTSAYTTYVNTGFYEKIPRAFESTLLLTGVKWKYSPIIGYYANGIVDLAALGKKQLHLATRVKMQMYHRGNGDYLIIYIGVGADHWYYFNYEFNSQTMTVQSSNGEWLDMIKGLTPEQRRVKGENNLGDYRYRVGNSRTEVPNFIMRVDNLKQAPNMSDDIDDDDDDE